MNSEDIGSLLTIFNLLRQENGELCLVFIANILFELTVDIEKYH